jgi:hypothetical protein
LPRRRIGDAEVVVVETAKERARRVREDLRRKLVRGMVLERVQAREVALSRECVGRECVSVGRRGIARVKQGEGSKEGSEAEGD